MLPQSRVKMYAISVKLETMQMSFRGCLCIKLISSFIPYLSFNWSTFLRRVTARWWRHWAKIQVWTSQNSRNNWYQIVTRTVCFVTFFQVSARPTTSSVATQVPNSFFIHLFYKTFLLFYVLSCFVFCCCAFLISRLRCQRNVSISNFGKDVYE